MAKRTTIFNPVVVKGAIDLIDKTKAIPGKFKEGWNEQNRVSKLPRTHPDRVAYDKKGKEEAMRVSTSFGLSFPVSSIGASAAIKAQSGILLSQKELAATRMLRSGAKPAELVKQGFTIGDIQKASQRNKGLGLLADFDNASQAKKPELMKQIADAIDNMPSSSPYAPYKGRFKNLTK